MAGGKQITLQRVVETAVELANEQGFEAVTLGSVAARLGIRTPSLYNHVAGLPGLQSEIAIWGSKILVEQIQRAAVGKSGRDAIFAVAHAYRDFAHAYPGIYGALLRAPTPEETDRVAAAQALIETLALVLSQYRLADDDVIHTIRALRSVMHGFIDLELAGGFRIPLDLDESFRRLIALFVVGLEAQAKNSLP